VAALLGDHDILGQFDGSLQTAWAPLGVRFVGAWPTARRMSTTTEENPPGFIDTARAS
jgi:hypothetical protein